MDKACEVCPQNHCGDCSMDGTECFECAEGFIELQNGECIPPNCRIWENEDDLLCSACEKGHYLTWDTKICLNLTQSHGYDLIEEQGILGVQCDAGSQYKVPGSPGICYDCDEGPWGTEHCATCQRADDGEHLDCLSCHGGLDISYPDVELDRSVDQYDS